MVVGNADISTGTSSLNRTINEKQIPRRIVEDPELCHRLVSFTNNRLSPPINAPQHFHGVHAATERSFVGFDLNEEAKNVDAFVLTANYVREFVVAADGLQLGDIKTVPCENESGIIPNKKMRRQGSDRITVELKNNRAFDHHVRGKGPR